MKVYSRKTGEELECYSFSTYVHSFSSNLGVDVRKLLPEDWFSIPQDNLTWFILFNEDRTKEIEFRPGMYITRYKDNLYVFTKEEFNNKFRRNP